MDCICKHMEKDYVDMDVVTYKSPTYKGFYLHENYGTWDMRFKDDSVYNRVEIFYCPFCGRQLNCWPWANDRRKENLKGVLSK